MMFPWKKPKPGTVPALFLHIQKTAGTSIVYLARQYYGANVTSHGDCWGLPPEQFRHVGFVSGHFGYDYARHLMKQRFSFTFLRNPAERILSMYYFCRTRDPSEFDIYRKAHEMNLSQFLEAGLTDPFIKAIIWNNQVWQLANGYTHLNNPHLDNHTLDFSTAELLSLAKQHIGEFSHVGFTKTFSVDVAVILKSLGIPNTIEVPILNVTHTRPKVDSLSPAVKAMLEELTELDQKLYDYAWFNLSLAQQTQQKRWLR